MLHPKVTASVVAGALVGMLVSELHRRGIRLEADEAANLTVLIAFAAGYYVPGDDATAPQPVPLASMDIPAPRPGVG